MALKDRFAYPRWIDWKDYLDREAFSFIFKLDINGRLRMNEVFDSKRMLEGCLLWLNEGLGHVDVVDLAVKEYRGQMSAIEAFMESECVRDINGRVKIADLYQAFVSWCEGTNERVISKRTFGMRLDEMNVEKYRDSDTWYRVGWRLDR